MQSHIVVGLGFGDEGKGSWVDHLVRTHGIDTVVRFNGGAQARHYVVAPDGSAHGFSQFCSGTFAGSKTVHSRFVLLEPLSLMAEAVELGKLGVSEPLDQLFISDRAPLIPYSNVLLNRIMEAARGDGRHGSCGLGIGLTQGDVETLGDDALSMGDLFSRRLKSKVAYAFDRAISAAEGWRHPASAQYREELLGFDQEDYLRLLRFFAERVRIVSDASILDMISCTPCVFEGAQGALLDERYGFFPHCTRSATTPRNAHMLLAESGFDGSVVTHGLLRAYGTRHGAGPFVSEDASIVAALCDNTTSAWQGVFRQGWFDAVTARYALKVAGEVDHFVLTNLDRLDGLGMVGLCRSYIGMDRRWYDVATDMLLPAKSLVESLERTDALCKAMPGVSFVSGWSGGDDPAQEAFIRRIEQETGHAVSAISREKGPHKVYR